MPKQNRITEYKDIKSKSVPISTNKDNCSTLFPSASQDTAMLLLVVLDNRHRAVMSTGRLGRLACAPGLLVGMGFWRENID